MIDKNNPKFQSTLDLATSFNAIMLIKMNQPEHLLQCHCCKIPNAERLTLTVSPCVTQFQCLSHGHGRFFISHGFTNFEWIFSPNSQFSLKMNTGNTFQCWKMHSSMISKNKTSSCSSLSWSWALLFIILVTAGIDNPFQWKPPQDLLKTAKKIHSRI